MNRLVLPLLVVLPGLAQDARQIVEESQRRGRSNSQRYEGVLEVAGGNSKVSTKSWKYERTGAYGNSKAVIRFTAPADVKGVALLVMNHTDRASDQWMWIPSIGRERRVALQDRSSRFFGTDFSFEDLEERDVNQFEYKFTGEEAVDAVACWRIESRPREGKSSQYTMTRIWIRKDNYVPAQFESYVKDQLARRLRYLDVENVQGIWTPRVMQMNDLRRNSQTILRLQKLEFNVPLKDEGFTIQALRLDQ